MFEGSKIKWLFVNSRKIEENMEELHKISETIRNAPRVGVPIMIKRLWFCSEAKTTYPALPQIVLQTLALTVVEGLQLPTTVNPALQALDRLKRENLQNI